MTRATPPQPPEHPAPRPPRREQLTEAQHTAVRRCCADVGVPAPPWLAWADAAATTLGPDYATRLAMLGAASQPEWDTPTPPTRTWWRRGR